MKHYLKISKILIVTLLVVPFFSFGKVAHAATDDTATISDCVTNAITAGLATGLVTAATMAAAGAAGAATGGTSAVSTLASVPVVDIVGNTALGTISGITTSAASFQNIGKMSLDSLSYSVAQCTLDQLTNNVVSWIKGGFNGSPAFAVDVQSLFEDVAVGVANDLTKEIRALAKCEFNFIDDLTNEIQVLPKKKKIDLKCPFPTTLTATQFYNDFNTLGWRGMQAALDDRGNKFGINVVTSAELAKRQTAAKATSDQKLSWSNGFADLIDTEATNCNYPEEVRNAIELNELTPENTKFYQKIYCPTTTPGKIIGDSLTKSIGVDMDRLGMADNMNKIISALIGTLTKQAVKGIFKYAMTPGGSRMGAVGGGNTGSWDFAGGSGSTGGVASYVSVGTARDVTQNGATLKGYITYPGTSGTAWFEWNISEADLSLPPLPENTNGPIDPNTDPTRVPPPAPYIYTAGTSATSYDYTISSLAPSTIYYFRAVGQTSDGATWYSASKSLTTLP